MRGERERIKNGAYNIKILYNIWKSTSTAMKKVSYRWCLRPQNTFNVFDYSASLSSDLPSTCKSMHLPLVHLERTLEQNP